MNKIWITVCFLSLILVFSTAAISFETRECKYVLEEMEVDPPSNNPCYSDIMHPDCDPSRVYTAMKKVRRCYTVTIDCESQWGKVDPRCPKDVMRE